MHRHHRPASDHAQAADEGGALCAANCSFATILLPPRVPALTPRRYPESAANRTDGGRDVLQNPIFLYTATASKLFNRRSLRLQHSKAYRAYEKSCHRSDPVGRNVPEMCQARYFHTMKLFDVQYLWNACADLHDSDTNQLLIFLGPSGADVALST
ncbi:hypothetical protein EVAR_43210_1 [Eumeta japonica]|uniref:Uncharacterized protein n=1 Tax=Eumeta variegata TaxID=151549 RepID=A0A4C1WVU6_EUMVA|nr:hypothetical protein EVAR_43210_1 [Eumeta japonica]